MRFLPSAALLLSAACPLASAESAAQPAPPAATPPAVVHFDIDATRDVKPISRFIYGVNQKLDGPYANLPYTRVGGNRWTAYNWVNNASNAGSDYQFQNDNFLGGGDAPGGALAPSIENASAHKAAILLTVPINGYVSADKKGGGDVRKSGADYLKTRFRPGQARKGAAFSLAPEAGAAAVYQDEFVNWVKTRFPYGFTDPQRPIFFALDNEPDLWAGTHKEVHPGPVTYAEVVGKSVEYAAAIKDVAPRAKVFGPANYGWQGYVNLQNAPDAGKRDFQEFYLHEMAAAEKQHGKRLLDVFDVHWYPEAQGGGQRVSGQDNGPAVVAARLQAPRSLWDPTYTEESWIAKWSTKGPVKLLPRLREKVAGNYPGTELSLSEYNYGGGGDVSGGIAEADVLGVFGREGVFAANEWPLAGDERFIAAGLRMYRGFDGKDANFGDQSVHAGTDDVSDSSVYASLDSAGPKRMVIIAINKTDRPITARMKMLHAPRYARAEVYQLTKAGPEPRKAEGVTVGDPGQFDYVMPGYSVSTLYLTAP